MRQLIQHRLKTKILGGGQASVQKHGQFIKNITDEQLAGGTIVVPPVNAVTHEGVVVTHLGVPVIHTP